MNNNNNNSHNSYNHDSGLDSMISTTRNNQARQYKEDFTKLMNNGGVSSNDNQNVEDNNQIDSLNLDDLKQRFLNPDEDDEIKKLEDEIKQRRENVQRLEQMKADIHKEGEADREKIRKEGKKLKNKYGAVKKQIAKNEAKCKEMTANCDLAQNRYAFFEPLLTGLNLDIKTGTCAEGKPIKADGAEGTCNGWDCPLLKLNEEDKAKEEADNTDLDTVANKTNPEK